MSKPAAASLSLEVVRKRRYPTFAGLQPSSLSSSSAKRANRAHSTKAEVCLQLALKKFGIRFRSNDGRVLGIPDVVLTEHRIVVFCDGDFWHGRRWPQLRLKLLRRANPSYWTAKIAANRLRDRRVVRALRQDGWLVMRFWETDIRNNPEKIAAKIYAKTAHASTSYRGARTSRANSTSGATVSGGNQKRISRRRRAPPPG